MQILHHVVSFLRTPLALSPPNVILALPSESNDLMKQLLFQLRQVNWD